jgi:hypothetical protein
MTIDPAQAQPTRNIGNQSAPWSNEVVTHAEIDSEIVILDPAKNRFGDGADIKLVVTTEPHVPLHHPPTNPRSHKLRADLVILRRIDGSK